MIMKKIYTAPECELLGTVNTEIICASEIGTMKATGLSDGLEIGWGSKDDGTHEADANEMVWDHFDNGWK